MASSSSIDFRNEFGIAKTDDSSAKTDPPNTITAIPNQIVRAIMISNREIPVPQILA